MGHLQIGHFICGKDLRQLWQIDKCLQGFNIISLFLLLL